MKNNFETSVDNMNNQDIINSAQDELNTRITAYYQMNDDGGNYEERFVIAERVASRWGLYDSSKLVF